MDIKNSKVTRFTKEEILNSIKQSNGNISTIATRLNCDWHTARKAIGKYKETQQAYINENEAMGDFVEQKGYEAVSNGDVQMIKFFLSTKYKSRGYEETSNINLDTNKNKLEIVIEE